MNKKTMPKDCVPFPPLEFPVMTHDKLGPLWDRLAMQLYALKYSDLVRAATSPAPAVVQMTDSEIKMIAYGHRIGSEAAVKFARAILSAVEAKNA